MNEKLEDKIRDLGERLNGEIVAKNVYKKENERLIEALKHRGPYYWDENEQSFVCDFCGAYGSDKHKGNCEYVKLTK